MPPGGVSVAIGGSYQLLAAYESNAPAVNAYVDGVVADGAYTITAAAYLADRAELTIRNDEPARALVVADLRIKGNPLLESPLTTRAAHAPSVARYGPREVTVDARLIQTQTQLELVASVLLEAFRSIDDDGLRRLPDLSFDALGLIHLTAGDRVQLSDPARGLGGDYTILGRHLVYQGGGLVLSDVRVRETQLPGVYLVLDRGILLDDGAIVGY